MVQPSILKSQKQQKMIEILRYILLFVFHNDWLQNHCWLSVKSKISNFVVVVSVLLPICCHIGGGMPYLCIFVEEVVMISGADKVI